MVASSSADGFGMEANGMATREVLRASHGDPDDALPYGGFISDFLDIELYCSDAVVAN